jgi:hypothetical protein
LRFMRMSSFGLAVQRADRGSCLLPKDLSEQASCDECNKAAQQYLYGKSPHI